MTQDLMKCDGCGKQVDSTTTSTCTTAHAELETFDIVLPTNINECPDDYFYCTDCINKYGMCKDCSDNIDEDKQKQIWER